jgi:colicin import membrane protein
MNQRHSSRISKTGAPPPADRVTAMPLAVSAMLHLLVLAAVIWMPNLTHDRGRSLSMIDVTMVSLEGALPGAPGPPAPSAPEPKPASPAAKAPEPVPAPEPPAPEPVPAPEPPTPEPAPQPVLPPPEPVPPPEADVSIAPPTPKKTPAAKPEKTETAPKSVPKVKKSLKRETYRPAPAVAKAISKLEKQVDSGRPAAVASAIERLRSEAGPREAIERMRTRVDGSAGTGSGTGTGTGGGGGGGGPLSMEDMYRLEVAYAVNKNWAFSESLAGGRNDLAAEVAFSVLPDGRIKDLWFDRKSGNSYLDESARRAILKSEPLPPHPKGIRRPSITVGLRFTPQGVIQ